MSQPFPYPAAAPGYATPTTADPTAVMGRRIVAIVVDFLLYLLIMAFVAPTPLSPLAEYYRIPDGMDYGEACDQLGRRDDVVGCLEIGDRAYVTDGTDVAIQAAVWLAFIGLYAWGQGATGFTLGKRLFGIKAVDEYGRKPGFGRSLGRTLLWVVDAQPCGIPLVGFITGLTTKGHRRVGDMVAKTFVVDRGHTGAVIVPGLTTAATGYPGAPGVPGGAPGWGAPPPGTGGPPWGPAPGPQPTPWGAPPAGGPASGPPTGAPAGSAPTAGPSPTAARPGGPPAGGHQPPARPSGEQPVVGRPSGEQRPATPASGWAAPGGTPADTRPSGAGPASQAGSGGYNPQWDAARGTYIVWEPNRRQWLGWDDRAKEWKPL